MKTKQCPNCGKSSSVESVVCPYCNTTFGVVATESREGESISHFLDRVPVRLSVFGTIGETLKLSSINLIPLLATVVLWLLTCWIPYINIGTTIAMLNLPVEMAHGKVINPLSIFDRKYRMYVGEFFLLCGFMFGGYLVGSLLFVIPGIVISYAWALGSFIMFDKKVNPIEALSLSAKATMGNKFRMFWVNLLSIFLFVIVAGVLVGLASNGNAFAGWLAAVMVVFCIAYSMVVNAVVYKNLVLKRGVGAVSTLTVAGGAASPSFAEAVEQEVVQPGTATSPNANRAEQVGAGSSWVDKLKDKKFLFILLAVFGVLAIGVGASSLLSKSDEGIQEGLYALAVNDSSVGDVQEENDVISGTPLLNEVMYYDSDGERVCDPDIRVQDWITLTKISVEEYEEAKKTAFKSYEHNPYAPATGGLDLYCSDREIRLEDPNEYQSYIYYGSSDALGGMHIVVLTGDDTDAYSLYSKKTGEELLCTYGDFPRVSPNSKYAVWVGKYGTAPSNPCNVTLYDVRGNSFNEVVAIPFKNWEISTEHHEDAFWGKDGAYYCPYSLTKSDGLAGYMRIVLNK